MRNRINSDNTYIQRINRTFDYIEQNLDTSLTIGELATVAHFSKFHFGRIFHAFVGETPYQFVTRLRVEKAAMLIMTVPALSLQEVALRCGFSDISVFSRCFKQHYKVAPSVFRKDHRSNSNNRQVYSNFQQEPGSLPSYLCNDLKNTKRLTRMEIVKDITVKFLPEKTVAYIRNMGPYNGDRELYQQHRERLFLWAGAQGLLESPTFQYLILYHDNPEVALTNNLRMSLCIAVPADTKVGGEIGKMLVAGGKYVVCRFEMEPKDFPCAWEWLYGEWLPNSGYQPDDKPYFETYPQEPKGELFLVDFCVPVKSIS